MKTPGLALILLLTGISGVSDGSGLLVDLSGDRQTCPVGRLLSEPISVLVTDSLTGEPIEEAQVIFSVNPGRGSLVAEDGCPSTVLLSDTISGCVYRLLVLTDKTGLATTSLRMPEGMGDVVIRADVVHPGFETRYVLFDELAIDVRTIVFEMIGGLALFLLGMRMMSEGLQRVAGNRMRTILGKLTGNRFMGLVAGTLVTAIIQSSSATTVIMVSFVNTGLMTLQQSLGVILGANIGTTVTGQLIAFRITSYAFPLLAVGLITMMIGRSSSTKFWGRVVLGLGMLLLGMNTMKGSLEPLETSLPVRDFFTTFSTSPLLGILAGTFITCLIQSSSATVGLSMTLAGAGLISLEGAVYLVLGDNVGTTITAQLAAVGTNRAARRAAMAHTLFNLIGALYFGLILARPGSLYLRFVQSTSSEVLRQVANAHTFFNIFNALVFLPLVPLLARLCRLIIPGRDPSTLDESEVRLSDSLLDTPVLAVDEIERKLLVMARYARRTVKSAFDCFFEGRPRSEEILAMEDRVDEMQSAITLYATQLFEKDLGHELSLRLPVLLHSVNDLERISDNAVNVVEAGERISGRLGMVDAPLLESARRASSIVIRMFDETISALERKDGLAGSAVLGLEERLNGIDEDARGSYTESLVGNCRDGLAGLAVLDFVDYCERVGDHLTNIAQSVIGGGTWRSEEESAR